MSQRSIIQMSLILFLSFKVESVCSSHVLSLLRKQVQGTKWEMYNIEDTIRKSLGTKWETYNIEDTIRQRLPSVYKRNSQFFDEYQRTHIESLFESLEGSMSLSMSLSMSMSMSMLMSMRLESDYPSLPPRTIDDKTPAPLSFDQVDSSDSVSASVPESLLDNSQQMIDSDSTDTVQMTSSPSFDALPNEIGGDIEREPGGKEKHSKLIAGGTTLVVLFGLSLIALLGMIAIRRRRSAEGTTSLDGSNV